MPLKVEEGTGHQLKNADLAVDAIKEKVNQMDSRTPFQKVLGNAQAVLAFLEIADPDELD